MSPSAGHAVLGVVIPVLNESTRLPHLLDDLSHLNLSAQVVVADGGSVDGTPDVARAGGARVVASPPGRARQLIRGAEELETDWLLFLHADCRLPIETARMLERWLDEAPVAEAAYFEFALEGEGWFWRFIEFGQRLRERWFGLVYGDQGLLVSRRAYQAVGGFPDLPLMEDVAMVDRLRGRAALGRIPARLITSPRRYRRDGRWRGWLRNSLLISAYRLGVPPGRLAHWYPNRQVEPSAESAGGRLLLVFAKEPKPGEVKTRLAETLGDEVAARVYEGLGRRVVDAVRDGAYRTVVLYAPAEAQPAMRAWLGADGLEFWAQSSGDLGTRLATAVDRALAEGSPVCVVGTDAPDVDRSVVEEAMRRLERFDLVVGPALDGGYYLLGLRAPAPTLFQGIPWSTEHVLESTLAAAASAGLTHSLLPPLGDVDTIGDLLTLA